MFLLRANKVFSELGAVRAEILKASGHSITLNSIIVCNTNSSAIRLNLQKISLDTTIYYIKNFEIKAGDTINLIKKFDLDIMLYYAEVEALEESLVSFTSSPATLKYDCEVNYTEILEQ